MASGNRQARVVSIFFVVVFSVACGDSGTGPEDAELDRELRALLIERADGLGIAYFKLPSSDQLDRIPQDPLNPLTHEKVALGRLLYHETALAVDNVLDQGTETYSCAACHCAQAGFMANLPQGIGEGGSGFGAAGEGRTHMPEYDSDPAAPDVQPIRTPTVLNGAYQELMLWNGQFGAAGANFGTESLWKEGTPLESNRLGFQGLETQAHAGLDVHRMVSIENSRVATIDVYRDLFDAAFPTDPEPINRLNAALAIAAFERTIVADRSPWQRWLAGDRAALTEQEKRGAILFFGEANCATCHTGPALNSMTFHSLGMSDIDASPGQSRVDLDPAGGTVPDETRRGRGGFTGNVADDYKFKTPQLYNLTNSPFYGHGASFSAVGDVVAYLNAGVAENAAVPLRQLAQEFTPLGLSSSDLDDMTAFLERSLHDNDLMRYVPGSLPSGNCVPVNDPQARSDLGC